MGKIYYATFPTDVDISQLFWRTLMIMLVALHVSFCKLTWKLARQNQNFTWSCLFIVDLKCKVGNSNIGIVYRLMRNYLIDEFKFCKNLNKVNNKVYNQTRKTTNMPFYTKLCHFKHKPILFYAKSCLYIQYQVINLTLVKCRLLIHKNEKTTLLFVKLFNTQL